MDIQEYDLTKNTSYLTIQYTTGKEDFSNHKNRIILTDNKYTEYHITRMFVYDDKGNTKELDMKYFEARNCYNDVAPLEINGNISRKLKLKFDKKNFIIKLDSWYRQEYDLYIYSENINIKYIGKYVTKGTYRYLYKRYMVNNRIYDVQVKNMSKKQIRLYNKIEKLLRDVNYYSSVGTSNEVYTNRFEKIIKYNTWINNTEKRLNESTYYNEIEVTD